VDSNEAVGRPKTAARFRGPRSSCPGRAPDACSTHRKRLWRLGTQLQLAL